MNQSFNKCDRRKFKNMSKEQILCTNFSHRCFYYTIEVAKLRSIREISSPEIYLSGITFKILVQLRHQIKDKFFVDISLRCMYAANTQIPIQTHKWSCEALATFKLLSTTNETLIEKNLSKWKFSGSSRQNTLAEFISWNDVKDPNSRYTSEGKLRFEIDIFANPVKIYNLSTIQMKCSKFAVPVKGVEQETKKLEIREAEWWFSIHKDNGVYLYNRANKALENWFAEVDIILSVLAFDNNEKKPLQFQRKIQTIVPFEEMQIVEKNILSRNELQSTQVGIWEKMNFVEIEITVHEPKPVWNWNDEVVEKPNELLLSLSTLGLSSSSCPVCMEPFRNCHISATKCGHQFCTPCIQHIVEQRGTCPLCNANAQVDDLRSIFFP